MRSTYIIILTNKWLVEMSKNRSKTGNVNRQSSKKPKNREFNFNGFVVTSCIVIYYEKQLLKPKSREPKFDDFEINYKNYFRTSLASISQLIMNIKLMGIHKPKNNFEIELQKWFDIAPKRFVQSFEKCLKNTCNKDYEVRIYNLMGELRKGVRIGLHDNYTKYYDDDYLAFASLGRTILPHLKQRIDFIINRKCPSMYIETEYEVFFENMKSDLKEFRKEIELFNVNFMDDIEYAKQKN